MLPLQFPVGENADDLACCSPRHGNILQLRFQVICQDDKGGKLFGIDEEGDALNVVVVGISESERFKNNILGMDVTHRKAIKEAASYVGALEIAFTVQEVIGEPAVPLRDLFSHPAALFGAFVTIRKETAETVDTAGKSLVTVAEPETNSATPAAIGVTIEGADPSFHRDRCKEGHDASPTTGFELQRTFGHRICPHQRDWMGFEVKGIDEFRSHAVNLSRATRSREDSGHLFL